MEEGTLTGLLPTALLLPGWLLLASVCLIRGFRVHAHDGNLCNEKQSVRWRKEWKDKLTKGIWIDWRLRVTIDWKEWKRWEDWLNVRKGMRGRGKRREESFDLPWPRREERSQSSEDQTRTSPDILESVQKHSESIEIDFVQVIHWKPLDKYDWNAPRLQYLVRYRLKEPDVAWSEFVVEDAYAVSWDKERRFWISNLEEARIR